ncbi:MAG: LPS assembly protein LptD [Novosphingobium sp.]|nr:LPS assembly protein LptD [Novosphingobium sp.]
MAALLVVATTSTAHAETGTDEATSETSKAREPIAFEADELQYHEDDEMVVALGEVIMRQVNQSVRADKVSWNRTTGVIIATGNVRMVDKDGNQLFTEFVELTEKFETGGMEEMLLALREGGRLAARSGERNDDGSVTLKQAAYSACPVEDSHGCPKAPSWRIAAREVTYNADKRSVSFKGARLELFGVVGLPLPGLKMRTDGQATSGILIPDFRLTPSNGVEISDSFYLRISDNRDLTATAYVYTKAAPMGALEYRALTEKGAYQITGYATSSRRIPISGGVPAKQNAFRGYLFANGKFQLSPAWSVTGSVRRATDRTFMRRYDISRDDRLRSTVNIERIDNHSYLSIAGWATQTLRVGDDQGQVPIALPVIDYRRRLRNPVAGGKVELHVNSLAIMRNRGQDTQRAFAKAQWDMRRITRMGQVVTVTALVRGDVYHSSNNQLSATAIYRGNSGWQTRGIAVGAIDMKWPFVGRALGGTQVFTPRVQLVASPPIRNLAVPNEDARAIDLEDSNLFALNRFPGYDRVEDGVRFTYGFDWQLERPGWRIKTTVGQSIRLSNEPTILPDGTGLTNRTSDVVGRTEVQFHNMVKFVHRFRLDKDNLAVRRHEFDASIGDHRTYIEVGYVHLNRNVAGTIEDLADREEVRVAGRIAFARYWSLFGSGVVNLTASTEDPVFGSDGFQPLRSRIGAAYQDDCLDISLTWRRDYVATGDAQKGDTFQVHFSLRKLGFR